MQSIDILSVFWILYFYFMFSNFLLMIFVIISQNCGAVPMADEFIVRCKITHLLVHSAS